MTTTFSPILPVYYEIFAEEKEKEFSKAFYFGEGATVEEAKGRITGVETQEAHEQYLMFDTGDKARVDRIITVNGKIGPAYDEYDAYALACLNCNVQAK